MANRSGADLERRTRLAQERARGKDPNRRWVLPPGMPTAHLPAKRLKPGSTGVVTDWIWGQSPQKALHAEENE